MAEPDDGDPRKQDGVLDGIFGMVKGVAEGVMHGEQPENEFISERTPSASTSNSLPPPPPSIGTNKPTTTKTVTPVNSPPANTSDIAAKVADRYKSELELTFGAAETKLQNFFAQKAALMKAQKNIIPDDQLELAATRGALEICGINVPELRDAFLGLKEFRKERRKGFNQAQAEKREAEVNQPHLLTAETEKEIRELESQRARLDDQIASKRNSIDPIRSRADEAEKALSSREDVYTAVESQINSTLESTLQNLLGLLGSNNSNQ